MWEKITSFFSSPFGQGLLNVCKALLLLALAFIVAAIVKKLVMMLMSKTKLKNLIDKADKEGDGTRIAGYIGKLVYLLVFLLFVPGIFSVLGASSIAAPILNVLDKVWGYVPNIVAAGIILTVGLLVAKLIRELLIPVFQKIKLDKLQEKAGIDVKDNAKLSNTLAYVVYVLIIIPVVIIALQALKISAISDPAVGMLNTVIGFIPNIIIGILIVGAGVWVAKLAGQIITSLIAATGVDKKLSDQLDGKAKEFVLSKIVGIVVQILIIVFFTVEGLSVLKLDILSGIGGSIISYMPKLLAAVIILALAITLASLLARFMNKNGIGRYAILAKIAIYIVAGFMILTQLGIAKDIVFWAFVIILAAVAVAAAIAFGIGGRNFAEKTLEKLDCKDDEEKACECEKECEDAEAAVEAPAEEAEEAPAEAEEEITEKAESFVEKISDSVDSGIDKIAGKFTKKE